MGNREVEHPYKTGEVLAGKYRVERVIGSGGMGVVLACTHLALEQLVAVKLLLPESAKKADVRGRFAREARAAVKLQSEHVARVIDVGTLDPLDHEAPINPRNSTSGEGSPFMVMEYLEGRDLGEIIDKDGALDSQEAVDYVLQACEAVAEAHALGIVHRDLKPSNLFLAKRSDRSRIIKVLDFGISKVAGADETVEKSLTRTTDVLGSPMYMSPEQLRSSRTVDTRADIWSLGVILFELLTLEPPFTGGTLAEICGSILHEQPKKLRDVRAGMPAGLETAILRCVEKAPSARFQTVNELAEAITPFGSEAAMYSRSQIRRWGTEAEAALADRDLQSTRAARPPRPEELAETRAVGATSLAEAKATNIAWGERHKTGASSRRSVLPWVLVGVVALGAAGVGAWQLNLVKPSQLGIGRADRRAAIDAVSASPVAAAAPSATASAAPATPSATATAEPVASAAPAVATAEASSSKTPTAPSAAARAATSATPRASASSAPSAAPSTKKGKPGKQASDGAWEPTTGVPLEQPPPEPPKAEDPY